MKVAIVHDYLHEVGGAEGVVNAIWELFPKADIYSATCDKKALDKAGILNGAKIFYPKWKDSIPGKFKNFLHKVLIANLPFYFSNLNLSKYDLIISSTAHFAKGVKTEKGKQIHISYIHTPSRFLYGFEGEIRKRSLWYWRILLFPLDSFLRVMDQKFAKNPDYLICNSKTVQDRIKKFYRRDATIIYPFPEVTVSEKDFKKAIEKKGQYFLVISRLAQYKNIDLIIKACGEKNILLKIAGKGPAFERYQELAKNYKSVELLGFVSDVMRSNLYTNCSVSLHAVKDEDFGMAPLETMMYGKPVIAYKQGGFLETVNSEVGVFFEELNVKSIQNAINKFEKIEFNPEKIRNHALSFSKENFKIKFIKFVEMAVKDLD